MSTEMRTSYSPSRYPLAGPCCPPHLARECSPHHRIVRECSRSPVRNEYHTAPPVVEKVFEKSVVIGAVGTEEQKLHSNEL